MLQVKELREKGSEELKDQLQQLSQELYKMNSELRISRKIDKPHLIREKKRDRARLLTILTEKSEGGKAS
jgi:large subunit ribosomal protein L29